MCGCTAAGMSVADLLAVQHVVHPPAALGNLGEHRLPLVFRTDHRRSGVRPFLNQPRHRSDRPGPPHGDLLRSERRTAAVGDVAAKDVPVRRFDQGQRKRITTWRPTGHIGSDLTAKRNPHQAEIRSFRTETYCIELVSTVPHRAPISRFPVQKQLQMGPFWLFRRLLLHQIRKTHLIRP